MDFGSLFWFFFLIASLQPVIRQRMLDTARLHMLDRLERRRKSRVIALIHRQETLSLLGFPLVRYINIEDSEAVLRAIMALYPQTTQRRPSVEYIPVPRSREPERPRPRGTA